MNLIDLFVVGAIVHFCMLGLRLVKHIEQQGEQE